MIALLGMLIIVATQFIAPKVGVASPLILLGVGLAIGFLPQVGAIEIAPHIILEIILPPLLFSAAVRMRGRRHHCQAQRRLAPHHYSA